MGWNPLISFVFNSEKSEHERSGGSGYLASDLTKEMGMHTLRVIIETVNALALGLWAGALAMVGVAAAVTFPAMKRLDPALPDFAAYEGEHWKLAAGTVMNPLFGVVSMVGTFSLAIVSVAFAILMFRKMVTPRSKSFHLRFWLWLALVALTGYVDRALWSPMNDLFQEHHALALAGNNAESARVMQGFDALHGLASPLMGAQLVLIVVMLVACLVNAFASKETAKA